MTAAIGRQIKSTTTVGDRKNTTTVERNQISMRNPKRQKVDNANWSMLCLDVLQMVLERLSATDFDRAKAVCSTWLSASRGSLRKQNRIPWLILFPYERSYRNSCRLLNPAEKSFVYRSRNLGVEFSQSRCLATCGTWLLMYHPQPKLYILNPLTRERITLPPLDSRKDDIIISPAEIYDSKLLSRDSIRSRAKALTEKAGDFLWETARLWVDESSKDYLVVWSHLQCCLFFSKKGDALWRMFPYLSSGLVDLVLCKGHLLYICDIVYFIEIYDFSRETPVPLTLRPYAYMIPPYLSDFHHTRIAVSTTSGEVLFVRYYDVHTTSSFCFYLYKLNHATKTWDYLPSLGDHALIFDLGITLPAKPHGIIPDSIYFSGHTSGTKHIFIFNLATRKVQPFISSTTKFFDARWFIPNV